MPGLLLWAVAIVLDASGAFHLTGWNASAASPADYPKIFSVWVVPTYADSPPIGGSYSVENGELIFRPRYPLRAGVRYNAVFQAPGEAKLEEEFQIRRVDRFETSHVQEVFPTSKEVPENILKFYIYFSAPMNRGESYQHVHLVEADTGKAVEPPFLELAEELWDREATRFTLLFEPGRIKRGLVPNREAGPAMVAGKSYTLVIDAGWRDSNNRPLGEEYRRTFLVLPPDRHPIKLEEWEIVAPAPGSMEILKVEFPRPLDRALLDHMLEVRAANGEPIPGNTWTSREERGWRLQPATPWKAGNYTLRVNTALEDLAGNKVDQPFDVDVFEHIDKTIRTETKSLRFTVK